MTLLFRNWGPLVQYRNGFLHVSDLNPEIRTQWQMSRWEMLGLGLRCIWASVFRT
jgi:hypothetical protein